MKNVLIVDGNKLILHGIAEYLRLFSKSLNVMTAENGRAAVGILESARIDMVVTDLSMPVMNGYKFLAYARMNYPFIPIVVMTSLHTPQVERNLEVMGVSHCVRKHNVKELASKILGRLSAGPDSRV